MSAERSVRARLPQLTIITSMAIALCGCPQDQTLTLVAKLTKDRQTIETYVKEIKQKFQPADPTYQEAKQRYLAAFSVYTGYVGAVRLSIQTGIKGDLSSLAAQAEAKSSAFLTYASDNIPQSRGLLSLLPQLDLAKIANYVISVRNDQRAQTANMVYDAVQWKDWDAIT